MRFPHQYSLCDCSASLTIPVDSRAAVVHLVHAIPDFLTEGAGNWKDIASRLQLWKSLAATDEASFRATVVRFNPDRFESLIDAVPPDATDVLVEYSWWPELLERLRTTRPDLRLHVRTHNAEAFQHFARTGWIIWPPLAAARAYYGCLRLALRDSRCRRTVDALWGISPWDNVRYWNRLPGAAKVVDFPYFCPWPELIADCPRADWSDRPEAIVSMPGVTDRIGQSMIDGYAQFVRTSISRQSHANWRFTISKGLRGDRNLPPDLPIDLLEEPLDPWKTLLNSRAIAVLGVRGFGLKTNVIDGIAAGCHVLVQPKLADRLPTEVVAQCIVVSPGDRRSVRDAWNQLTIPPRDPIGFHAELRTSALQLARRLLQVASPSPVA